MTDTKIAHTARGPVEYAVVGTGAPVVVLHGSPGGIDAAELMAGFLPRDEIAAILLSRPGYLGTPLDGRGTPDDQADLVAALLDELRIDRAGIFSWSGGGPSGYRFAVRHPDRTDALVAFAAVSEAYTLPDQDLATRLMFTSAPGRWLMRLLASHQPEQYIRGALSGEGDLTKEQLDQRVAEVFADPVKRDFVLALGPTAEQDKTRRVGFRNDIDLFAQITTLELEKIIAPTLVVQGTADADLPPEHSYHAAKTIPGTELLTLDTGTHLGLYTHPDAAAAQQRVVDFLLRR
ncbi:MAG: alpha/beta hydrolase [Pseudonocardiaceae bacterium]|nr:MAG: alpha/beta hydrolase [Pseudonocardiaceae bacterium]